jgi:hypothetical protein
MEGIYPNFVYKMSMDEYKHHVEMLEIKRKKFYEDNPDFPYKTMYMNVIAPPVKIELKMVK